MSMNEKEMKKRLNDFGVQEVRILESDQATNRIRLYFLAGTCKVQKQSPIPGYENKKRPDDLDTRGWKVKGEPKVKGLSALQTGYWIGLSQGQTQVEIQFFLDRNDTDPYTTQVIIPPWLNTSTPEETDSPMPPPPSDETKSNHSRAASQAATGQAGQKGNGFQAATPSNSQDLYKQKQEDTLPPQTTTYKYPELGGKNQSTKKNWPGQSQGGDAGRSNITNNDWEKKAFGDDQLGTIITQLNALRLKVQTLESGPQGPEFDTLKSDIKTLRGHLTTLKEEIKKETKDEFDISWKREEKKLSALEKGLKDSFEKDIKGPLDTRLTDLNQEILKISKAIEKIESQIENAKGLENRIKNIEGAIDKPDKSEDIKLIMEKFEAFDQFMLNDFSPLKEEFDKIRQPLESVQATIDAQFADVQNTIDAIIQQYQTNLQTTAKKYLEDYQSTANLCLENFQSVTEKILEDIQNAISQWQSNPSVEVLRKQETDKRLIMLQGAIERDLCKQTGISQKGNKEFNLFRESIKKVLLNLFMDSYDPQEKGFLEELSKGLLEGLNNIANRLPATILPSANGWRDKALERANTAWKAACDKALDSFEDSENGIMPDPWAEYPGILDTEVKTVWNEYRAELEKCKKDMISGDKELMEEVENFVSTQVYLFISNAPDKLKAWYTGLPKEKRKTPEEVKKVMDQIMEISGIEEIRVEPQKTLFDASLHNIIQQETQNSLRPNVVLEKLSPGYWFKKNQKVISKAGVSINKR